ncbi:MAG: hypothetical protein QW757_02200, partial [Candidatus Woesearchaeota archaeon]
MNEEQKVLEKSQKEKKSIKSKLKKKVEIPVFLIFLVIFLVFLISLFAIRVPYKAKEKYSEVEYYVVEVSDIVEDKDNPKTERVCVEKDAKVKLSELFVYAKPYGLSSYKCYADFKIINENNINGEFVYKFVFDINGKKVETEEKKGFIPKFSSLKYSFETDCLEGDKPTGEPILVSAPKTIECKYETIYPNITVFRNETRQREVLKERIVEKTESLFERLIGK